MMDPKHELLDLSRAFQEMLEKCPRDYEALVRTTRWGEGPIFALGEASSYYLALSAGHALESLLAWPVVVRTASEFVAYGLPLLRPRSIVLAFPENTGSEELLEAARSAHSGGAVVLSVMPDPTTALARASDGVFRLGAGAVTGIKTLLLGQVGVHLIALVAAGVLKRHAPQLDALEREFKNLPHHVDWLLAQLGDAVRSFASELRAARQVRFAGAGCYHPVALQAAYLVKKVGSLAAQGFDSTELVDALPPALGREDALTILSGSRCRMKKKNHQLAADFEAGGAKLIAVTDANDRELADRSALAILLPVLTEMVGAILSLVLVASVAAEIAREDGRKQKTATT